MANLHRVREDLVHAYFLDVIDDEEFMFLYDINRPTNLDFQYNDYKFDIDNFNDDECNSYFRFKKDDVFRLKDVLHVPERIVCANGSRVDGLEALCVMLQRYAFPCRYGDMLKDYGRSVPQLSLIFNEMTNFMYINYQHLFSSLDQEWLSPLNLINYANAVHGKGAAMTNCWGFVDGTVRPICRPKVHQRIMYNGHKRIHALKYQSVTGANGLIAHLFGPMEGRRHDAYILRESGLLTELEARSFDPDGNILCIYGDPAYPLRPHLQAPFPKANITPEQEEYNKAMSKVRISVEWIFGDMINYFKFNDFRKTQKVLLSACGKMYSVCGLLTNAHTCLYGNSTSKYFELEPPTVEEYFQAGR